MGEGTEQDADGGRARRVGAGRELGDAVGRGPQLAHQALGPLRVAAQPEQVLRGPGRHHRHRLHHVGGVGALQPEPGEAFGLAGQHPGVLAPRPALVGDERVVGVGSHPGEPAGHQHVALLLGHRVGAQDGATRFEHPARQGGRLAEGQRLLAHPGVGAGLDAGPELLALVAGEGPGGDGGRPLAVGEGLDHQVVEAVEHPAQPGRVAAPVGLDRRQEQVLVEQGAAQLGEEREQGRVLDHAAAQGVDHRHVADAAGLEQAGHAQVGVGAELQRVAPGGVDPTEDHVHRFEAAEGAHPDPAVSHPEVGALHERVAEVAGQVAVLERRLAAGAGGEHHDARRAVGVGRHPLEGGPQLPEERGQADHVGVAVEVGEHPRDHHPVLVGVAHARRGLGAVADDHPVAGGVATQVEGGVAELVAGGETDLVGLADEAVVGEHHLGRQHARREQLAPAVEVAEHQVEQLGPLQQPGLHPGPLLGGEHHRYRVEPPGSGHGPAVDGHVVGDPVVDQQLAGFPDPVGELGRFEVAERSGHLRPVLSHAVGAHELVVGPGTRSVAVDEVRGGVGGHGGEAGPGTERRRSRVRGYPSPRGCWASRGATATGPGVCPEAVNRDPRRDSASLAFTGKVS